MIKRKKWIHEKWKDEMKVSDKYENEKSKSKFRQKILQHAND